MVDRLDKAIETMLRWQLMSLDATKMLKSYRMLANANFFIIGLTSIVVGEPLKT
jgi:hypothetical protein